MLISRGWIVFLLTFPGIMVHELAHQLFCVLVGVRVRKVCYLRLGRTSGYVLHDQPRAAWKQLFIGIGPFIVNTAVGAAIAYPGVTALFQHRAAEADYLLVWLGIAIAMHSFPSTDDGANIWRALWTKGTPILVRLVSLPIVALIYLGALGSLLWLDLVYGVAVVLLPRYLLRLLS